MSLTVDTKNITVGILAIIASNPELKKSVTVQAGSAFLYKDSNVELKTLPNTVRYLIRAHNLLDESNANNQLAAYLLDLALVNNTDALKARIAAKTTTFLTGDAPTFADFGAWCNLRSEGQTDYIKAVEATEPAQEAIKWAAELAANAPKEALTIPDVPGTGSDPSVNPMDVFKNLITVQIAALGNLDPVIVYQAIDNPRSLENGDLAIALPRLRLKGNPAAIAKEWAASFVPNEYVTESSAAGPFLNFRINKTALIKLTLGQVSDKVEKYGHNSLGNGKTVIVEFSSPNIAKPFHAGHLRSTIIGAFVRNIYDANGWKTITMNYLGDWGKQYGLLAVGFAKYGSEEKLIADPIKHLYDVYVAINKDAGEDETIHDQARSYFKKMEDGDEEALALWRRFRDLSIVKYKGIYGRLNIHFDVYSGESQVGKGMAEAMKLLHECKLLEESEGALIIDMEKYKLGKTVVQKKDGTTLYLTRDIGAAMERYEKYKFDKMIYVVASQQDLHLKQLFKTLEMLKFEWANKLEHINFGMVLGMSTRKGTVVFLEDILEEAKETMHEVMRKNEKKYAEIADPEQVADEIGISAVKIQDNSARRIKNYDFDMARMCTFEGDTGPYIQYAHARLASVERKSGLEINHNADLSLLTEPQAVDVIRTVAQYPDLIKSLLNGYEPCNVVTYAFKLSHDISACFENLWVRGADPAIADARLLMYWSARITLGNAMRMLGLRPLERM
ncbi:arginyl-tRNA synthetase [Mucor circinelloides]